MISLCVLCVSVVRLSPRPFIQPDSFENFREARMRAERVEGRVYPKKADEPTMLVRSPFNEIERFFRIAQGFDFIELPVFLRHVENRQL